MDNEKPSTHFDEQALAATGTRQTDTEKASSYAQSETGLTHKSETHKAERKLLLKLDAAILPFAVLLYLSAYLDRGNLANARLQGLETDVLDDKDINYSYALITFFIAYIVFSVPGTLLAKQYVPSRTIAMGALIWSVGATCQAAAYNRAGLYVCRLLVGIGEACFGQAMALHLSFWYTKSDLAKRVGLFISAGAVSGAFGGLIAYGVSSIHHPKIEAWRVLFLIEGVPSVVLAICTFFFLPSRPETSRYLNETERTLCLTRLNRDSMVESGLGIDWAGVRRCLLDWKTYVISIMYSCMNLTLASVGGFLPTIIKGLGYSNARAQLFTVPPYVVALVFMLLLTSLSDKTQQRGLPVALVFIIGIVGWALLLSLSAKAYYSARYFACICIVTAGYTNIPLIIAWQAGNTGNQSQRATSLGMLNTLGQGLSLAAAFLFPSSEKPQWTKGCAINLAFQVFGLVIALSMTAYYRYENKRRDKVEGGRPPKGTVLDVIEQHDLAPGFRYVP
ncbi:MFS transporter, ACS family, pantothenate transporter, partial [Tremellales sp. Uapishka_1]